MTSVIFDVETTGIFPKGTDYIDLDAFDRSRLVSISWILTQKEDIIEQSYFIVKPEGWLISEDSTEIHGITQKHAEETGSDIETVLNTFMKSVKKAKTLVAHNIEFDENIIKSELFRHKMNNHLSEFGNKHKVCTMKKGRSFMNITKYPKLSELYMFLYETEMTNSHNAFYDTMHCFKCYIKMFPSDKNIFYLGEKEVLLTEEQQKVVFENHETNMLIIAGAGSGKTMSIIARIKFLIDSGVDESSIMLTTFTRNASHDMKERLQDALGYKSNVQVGTIDSISKYYVDMNCVHNIEEVNEYAPTFLELLRKKPSVCAKFRYLLVDEIQDINKVQFEIIYEFFKKGTFVTGIGDDCQNIYEFRGSKIEYILNFKKHFPNTVIHMLTHNFRSTQHIVNLANAVIDNNTGQIKKVMIASDPMQTAYPKPIVKTFPNIEKQFLYIVEQIQVLRTEGYKEDNICIMSSMNKPLVEISKVLKNNSIPCYYNVVTDDLNSMKMPGNVALNTIHRSKGLEWDVVFIVNANDDLNKNAWKFNKENQQKYNKLIEANRRLLYVAVTRAKKYLFILSDRPSELTRFVTELNTELFG